MRGAYVIYGSMPWQTPWAVDQNLAHALAAKHDVLYVDPPVSPMTPFRRGPRHVSSAELRALVARRIRTDGRLRTFRPLVLPPIEHPISQAISKPMLRRQIRAAVAKAGLAHPVALSFRPLQPLAGAADERLAVAVVMDHLSAGAALMGRDPARLEGELRATCEAADLVVVPSRPVADLLEQRGFSTRRVPFGFAADLAPAFDHATPPPEYAKLPRPILGYTGGIDDRLDFELIVRLADRFGDGSVVFVGPLSPRLSDANLGSLRSRPNIHLLGVRERTELPAYIRHLDVSLMPYVDTEWTRHQSPLKVWEYLYAGPPIVATGSTELRRLPPSLVYFASSPAHAQQLVEQALAAGADGREQRRAHALANTWDHRAAALDDLVVAHLASAVHTTKPAAALTGLKIVRNSHLGRASRGRGQR
jgi:teichuronic acid biosynthesis glycosyltransferase TuaH